MRRVINDWTELEWDKEAWVLWNPRLLGKAMGYSLKFFCPVILILIFCNNVGQFVNERYEGYPDGVQAMG